MAKSEHAQVAGIIRKEMKKHGVVGKVSCKSYSGGSSVSVSLQSAAPWVKDQVEAFANQFQYGHFDGMTDCYEYSNSRKDLPLVKFVFVNNNFTDEEKAQAREYVESVLNLDHFDDYDLQRETWQYLNGSSQLGCYFKKPLVKYTNKAA